MAALLRPHLDKADDDPDWSVHRKRRKFRGQARYYRKIQRKAQAFSPGLSVADWYDLWHYHADWPGHGNLSWKHRRRHLEALCIVFQTFVRDTANYRQPYQLWLDLDGGDAGQDAVYFHTPNPNRGSHFPIRNTGINWGLPVLEEYLGRLVGLPMRAGRLLSGKSRQIFYAYSPACGEPLEGQHEYSGREHKE